MKSENKSSVSFINAPFICPISMAKRCSIFAPLDNYLEYKIKFTFDMKFSSVPTQTGQGHIVFTKLSL